MPKLMIDYFIGTDNGWAADPTQFFIDSRPSHVHVIRMDKLYHIAVFHELPEFHKRGADNEYLDYESQRIRLQSYLALAHKIFRQPSSKRRAK